MVQGPRRRDHRHPRHRCLDARQPGIGCRRRQPANGAWHPSRRTTGKPVVRGERRWRRRGASSRARTSSSRTASSSSATAPRAQRSTPPNGGFPSTVADLESDPSSSTTESDYFGGQKINEVLVQASKDVVPGWTYLPFQTYANSIFGDTVGPGLRLEQRPERRAHRLAGREHQVWKPARIHRFRQVGHRAVRKPCDARLADRPPREKRISLPCPL